MAPLKVIGAGVSRSGTDSLRAALNMLGYNTLHMREMLAGKSRPELFTEAFNHPEKTPDWNLMYEGFDAAVDCPTFTFTDKLIEYYPDIKVILTKRDADSWYESVLNTVFKHNAETLPASTDETDVKIREMIQTTFLDGSFHDFQKFKDDPETMKARYNAHNEWVMKVVPADRLLVLDLRDGVSWEKICPFLDKPIPEEPYPHVNTRKAFNKDFLEIQEAIDNREPASITAS